MADTAERDMIKTLTFSGDEIIELRNVLRYFIEPLKGHNPNQKTTKGELRPSSYSIFYAYINDMVKPYLLQDSEFTEILPGELLLRLMDLMQKEADNYLKGPTAKERRLGMTSTPYEQQARRISDAIRYIDAYYRPAEDRALLINSSIRESDLARLFVSRQQVNGIYEKLEDTIFHMLSALPSKEGVLAEVYYSTSDRLNRNALELLQLRNSVEPNSNMRLQFGPPLLSLLNALKLEELTYVNLIDDFNRGSNPDLQQITFFTKQANYLHTLTGELYGRFILRNNN